jgi:hypothetical protein
MTTNLPLALLLLIGSGLLMYAAITDAPGGVVGVLGQALHGGGAAGPVKPNTWVGPLTAPVHRSGPTPTVPGLISGGLLP